jgi:hypothetical protein
MTATHTTNCIASNTPVLYGQLGPGGHDGGQIGVGLTGVGGKWSATGEVS